MLTSSLGATCLRQTSAIVFFAIDSIVPVRGKSHAGFDEFIAKLDHTGLPIVWVTARSRLQMDEPRRKFGHQHPFIGENGCGVYLPEDYFHLRPTKTVRMGRFTCIPVAEVQPAASEALESVAEETGISVVPLRSLAPRELAQNTGLPTRDAELARQRDFDELFFFAGASQADEQRFAAETARRNAVLRQQGVLWSLAVGANVSQCIRDLSKLYERALRSHPAIIGIATPAEAEGFLSVCDRGLILANQSQLDSLAEASRGTKNKVLPRNSPDVWDLVLAAVTARKETVSKA
jgi:predicted mannosyl-3-phosphoglycerate phosphatase (HAD superfamily)